jgi:DNA-binding MarR family transcriptional regulator
MPKGRDTKTICIAAIEYSRGINELVEQDPPLKLLVMFALGASGESPPTVGEIGQLIAQDTKVASRGLALLRRRGWVKLVGDLQDTRMRRVRLTRAGETVLTAMLGALVDTSSRILESAQGGEGPEIPQGQTVRKRGTKKM